MIIRYSDDNERAISLNIGTGINAKTGKEYIYCELSYHDKKADKVYNRVFSAAKYDEVLKLFYALHNYAVPKAEIPRLFNNRRVTAR